MHFIVIEKGALEKYITERLIADGEAYVRAMQETRTELVQDLKKCAFQQTALMLAGMIAGLDAAIAIAAGEKHAETT